MKYKLMKKAAAAMLSAAMAVSVLPYAGRADIQIEAEKQCAGMEGYESGFKGQQCL